MEPTKQVALKWAQALWSGKYKQGKGRLQNTNGYCCLGVACEVFIPKAKQGIMRWAERLSGLMPGNQPAAPDWLKEVNDDFKYKTGEYLSALNDSGEYSFNEIADLIYMVYVLRVFGLN